MAKLSVEELNETLELDEFGIDESKEKRRQRLDKKKKDKEKRSRKEQYYEDM